MLPRTIEGSVQGPETWDNNESTTEPTRWGVADEAAKQGDARAGIEAGNLRANAERFPEELVGTLVGTLEGRAQGP